jgi:hypothetical protein
MPEGSTKLVERFSEALDAVKKSKLKSKNTKKGFKLFRSS